MTRTQRRSAIVFTALGWSGVVLGSWALCLLVLQVLFGRQLEMLQTVQLGRDLSLNVRLTELALERYPPGLVSELTGLDLAVIDRPPDPPRFDHSLQRQTDALQRQLCQRLSHCPILVPFSAEAAQRGAWICLLYTSDAADE